MIDETVQPATEQNPEQTPEMMKEAERELLRPILQILKQKIDDEDKTVRERKLREYRLLNLLWEGFTTLYWNEDAGNFHVPETTDLEDNDEIPRNINIYRPYGESIIAALTTIVPGVIFYPDDAENPDDIEAADAYQAIADLIGRHTNSKLLFIKAIMILYNQGTIFGYNYLKADPQFGIYRDSKIEFSQQQYQESVCPDCGTQMDSPGICPGCGQAVQPVMMESTESVPQIVGYSETPKARTELDLFGPLFVKVPYHARKQDEIGYLRLEFEQSDPMLKATYPEIADKIKGTNDSSSYERWSRLDSVYYGDSPRNVSTVSCYWLRPWQYHSLEEADKIATLTEKFPNGVYFCFVNDQLADWFEEKLDDHWTISFNPLSNFIHSMPLGQPVSVIQDIRNDVVDIQVQTAEYGIPETFASPKTVDFEKYGQEKAKVGMVTPATPIPGKGLADSFYVTTPARLAPEVKELKKDLDQDAQFGIGAYPSVYGGAMIGGSQTAHEYEQSKAQALQRLGLTYYIVSNFWTQLLSRASVEFAQYVKENGSQKFVTRKSGQFLNVWINESSLLGSIGHVEPEYSDQLPMTWAQKKDVLVQLMQFNSPELNAILMHPRNFELMKKAIGITDFYIPGNDSRTKQLKEFYLLVEAAPIMGMMGEEMPSVDIDPDVDEDAIEMAVLKSLLISPIGQYVKNTKPDGYRNAVLHYKRHELNFAAKTMKPSGTSAPGEKPEDSNA